MLLWILPLFYSYFPSCRFRPSGLFLFRNIQKLWILETVGRTPWTGDQPVTSCLRTQDNTNRIMRTHVSASSGIRTHDPSVRAGKIFSVVGGTTVVIGTHLARNPKFRCRFYNSRLMDFIWSSERPTIMFLNIVTFLWSVTIDGFWINDLIYLALWYSAWLHPTVHCYTHVFTAFAW
jgi:hypothetical protein